MIRLVVLLAGGALLSAQTTPLKLKPETMAFTFTKGDAKLPAAQTITVSGTAGKPLTAAASGGEWLTVSPAIAAIPSTLKVIVNPTTLAVGTYTGVVTVTAGSSSPESATVPVTLTVKSPPSTLSVSPAAATATYTRGLDTPDPITLNLTTSESILPFSTKASGGTWLTVTPASGAVFPAFPAPVKNAINVSGLAPGTYSGSVAIAAAQAANKSLTVKVTLTVQPGAPVFNSMWPYQITQGAGDTTLTLTGNNFASNSVVKAGTTTLSSSFVGANAMTAVLPASMLAAPAALSVVVSNPGDGGGDSGDRTFTVLSSAPALKAVVHGASLATGAISPGQIVVFFGTGLGPDTLTTFTPPAPGDRIATSLSGTSVLFSGAPSPVLYTSATQVAALAPYGLNGFGSTPVQISYNGASTASTTVSVAPARPGIFTSSGTGTGQAVLFNFDTQTGVYTLNEERAPASKGTIIVFYVTGVGPTSPASLDGQIATAASGSLHPGLAVHIGGADSEVLYAGSVPGLSTSILQVNAKVPDLKANKATPLKVFVNGAESADGVTLSVK